MTGYRPRSLAARLHSALRGMPVVVLTGMRQTGKTTLLTQDPIFAGADRYSLDDFELLQSARNDPASLLSGRAEGKVLVIDEVQKAPGLVPAIKRAVDLSGRRSRFILSGSANLLLMEQVTESLAGRAVYLTLHPFTRRELDHLVADKEPFLVRCFQAAGRTGRKTPGGNNALARWIRHQRGGPPVGWRDVVLGGMPPVVLREAGDPAEWMRGFEQTYLERDVRDLSRLADLTGFHRYMKLTALRTAGILNVAELGRDAGLQAMTTARYLELMEMSFSVYRLTPFRANRASRIIKAPKIFFADSGLAAHLAGVAPDSKALDIEEPLRGNLYETYIHQNLRGLLEAHWPSASLHYWNVQGRYEVDFVIEAGREFLAIEVKAGTRWDDSDLKGLRAFLDATPRCRLAILAYNGTEPASLGGRLWAVPLRMLLS